MLHLPEPMQDETLYSLLGRIVRVNGYVDHLKGFQELVGQAKSSSIVKTSLGLKSFCQKTHLAYGSVEQVLGKFTHLPLLAHMSFIESPTPRLHQTEAVWLQGTHFDFSGNPFREWRECPQCSAEDEARMGFSYWRRSHQLATSTVCHLHKQKLLRKRMLGQKLHEHFWMPDEFPSKDEVDDLGLHDYVAEELSVFGWEALQDHSLTQKAAVVRKAILQTLGQKKLLTRNGKPKVKESIASLAKTTGLNCADGYWMEEVKRLLLYISGQDQPQKTQNFLLILYWLFGSWQGFKEQYKWMSIFDYDSDELPEPKANSYESLIQVQQELSYHREICEKFIKSHARASRTKFMETQYKSFNWLLQYDRAWLNERLPFAKNLRQAKLFDGI